MRTVFVLALGAVTASAQTVTVGPNIQVSKALANDTHFEMQLAADPTHAARLLACSMLWPADYSNSEVVTYATFDGGRSWAPTLRTRAEAGNSSWDPTCGYGPAGVAYTVSENIDKDAKSFDRIDRSGDGGKSWEPAVRFKHAERNFITIDNTGGPRNAWIYLQGAGQACVTGVRCSSPGATYFQYSTDGGRTFVSQLVPVADNNYAIGFGPGVVLADGTFLAPRGEWKNVYQGDGQMRIPKSSMDHDGRWANGHLVVFRSRFDKPNWPLETEVFPVGEWFVDRTWSNSYLPMMAVDASNGPFRNRVYMVWPDVGSGRSQILLAYSSDAGKTWSKPRVINDDRSRSDGAGPDDFHGVVAVNPQGVVGVSWYDRRGHPDNLGWTVRFRASLDGGETFAPSVPVSEIPYRPERTDPIPLMSGHESRQPDAQTRLGVHSFHFSGGHTAGLAASVDGVFHALWVGNSTGVPQLWTVPITVAGVPEKNGSAGLAGLVDVSGKVEPVFTNARLVRSTKMVEADLQLANLSEDTLDGPLKLRVLDLASDLGAPEIENSDEGGKGEGAVFDFTPLLESGVLQPKSRTRLRQVRIRMRELDPIRPSGPVAIASLASFNSKVLAGSVTGPAKDR